MARERARVKRVTTLQLFRKVNKAEQAKTQVLLAAGGKRSKKEHGRERERADTCVALCYCCWERKKHKQHCNWEWVRDGGAMTSTTCWSPRAENPSIALELDFGLLPLKRRLDFGLALAMWVFALLFLWLLFCCCCLYRSSYVCMFDVHRHIYAHMHAYTVMLLLLCCVVDRHNWKHYEQCKQIWNCETNKWRK